MKRFEEVKAFFHRHKVGKAVLIVLGGMLIFVAGMRFGEMKAWFSYRWAESYSANFGGERFAPPGPRMPGRFFNGHGVFGEVIRVQGNHIFVKDRDGSEKIIVITNQTTIRRGPQDIESGRLDPNELIMVVGDPDQDGRIDARFIRVFPENGGLTIIHPFAGYGG